MHIARRRLAVIGVLGFSSGLPLALTDSTLQAWLAVSGADMATIGVFSLVGLPFVLKFLWAPALDRFLPPLLGRRRGWILMTQGALVVVITGFAGLDPAGGVYLLAAVALLLAFVSATQDTAIDAYRAEVLRPEERGLGAGLSVMGYRVALLVSGAGALLVADHAGFGSAYACVGVLVMFGVAATLAGEEPAVTAVPPPTLRAAVVEPFRQLLERDRALSLIALVLLYKLGDALAGRLMTAFLVRDLGFSLSDIAAVYKVVGLVASIAGAIGGGALMYRLGLYRALLLFAWLQAVTNLGFAVLALMDKSLLAMAGAIALENLSGGMGTAAFVALLMALCEARYSATQFAFLTAVASTARVLVGPPAGYLVVLLGWPTFFGFTAMVSVPAIMLLRSLRVVVEAVGAVDRGATR